MLRIADGDSVATNMVDAGGRDQTDQQVTASGNPMTEPFFIEGTEPGDALEVRIGWLTPNRDTGVTATVIAEAVLDPAAVRSSHPGAWCDGPLIAWPAQCPRGPRMDHGKG